MVRGRTGRAYLHISPDDEPFSLGVAELKEFVSDGLHSVCGRVKLAVDTNAVGILLLCRHGSVRRRRHRYAKVGWRVESRW